MDIKQYNNRLKFKSLPEGFNHQRGENYKSSFEYTKNFSNYHFDKWVNETEGEWFNILGRFEGNWDTELSALIEKSKDLSWDQSTAQGKRPGFPGGVSPMKAQEDYDRKQHGLDKTDQTHLVLEDFVDNCPTIKKMIDFWKLENVSYRAHVQWPGECFGIHIDKLWHRNPSDPGRIIRIVVHLADFEPGQLMVYGNAVHTQWRAGDIHMFDTLNIPHGTVNLSIKPRPNLVITGLTTEHTLKILENSKTDSRYKL